MPQVKHGLKYFIYSSNYRHADRSVDRFDGKEARLAGEGEDSHQVEGVGEEGPDLAQVRHVVHLLGDEAGHTRPRHRHPAALPGAA